MNIVIIAAKSDNNVIGKGGELPWSMPADERFFFRQIKDAYLLTGRKSYESQQGSQIFRDADHIVLTRRADYQPGHRGKVAQSWEEAINTARRDGAGRLCILGGGAIYHQAMDKAGQLIITEIHTTVEEGDAFFPEIDPAQWEAYARYPHPADAENPYPYTFSFYRRI